jgi:transposase
VGADQKKARRRRGSIVFLDETGFRLQPLNRRTWAPRGCTPEQRSWDRRDRLSVIGAITLAPVRHRVGAYFDVQRENVRGDDVVDFLRRLRQKFRRPLVIVWDRWNVHRSAQQRIAKRRWKGIEFEYLPAYAPELNPVEAMWSHAKYADLANYVPDDADHLDAAVKQSLRNQSQNHRLKRSYFKTAQLRL